MLFSLRNDKTERRRPTAAMGSESNISTGTFKQQKNTPIKLIPKPANAILITPLLEISLSLVVLQAKLFT